MKGGILKMLNILDFYIYGNCWRGSVCFNAPKYTGSYRMETLP